MASAPFVNRGRCGRVARTDHGATAAEYAIVAGFIAAVVAGTVTAFGQAVLGLFQSFPLNVLP